VHIDLYVILAVALNESVKLILLVICSIPLGATSLALRPWTRLVHADSETMLSKVTIDLDGVPAHAWDLDTASKLLAGSCWIEQLGEATRTKDDMSTFRLMALDGPPGFVVPLARRPDATGDGGLATTEAGRDDAQL